jgi:predicted protein tyrosine phosphatase
VSGRIISVLPRATVRHIIEHKEPQAGHWALISIYSSPKEKLVGPEEEETLKEIGCEKVLSLCFGDYDYSCLEVIKERNEEELLFNTTHAEKVIDFVKSFDEKHQFMSYSTLLVVHCDAGVSRSGALGLWSCRYLGYDEKEFRKTNNNIHPNSLIYDTLCKVSGMKESYQNFWDNLDPVEDIWGIFSEDDGEQIL